MGIYRHLVIIIFFQEEKMEELQKPVEASKATCKFELRLAIIDESSFMTHEFVWLIFKLSEVQQVVQHWEQWSFQELVLQLELVLEP